jgi:PASTA domain
VKELVFLFAFLLVGIASAAPSVVSTTQTAATAEGLDCGSQYRFEIQKHAENGELISAASSVDAQTKSCSDTQPPADTQSPPDTQSPSAPQDLAAPGPTQASILVSQRASTGTVDVARCAVPDVRKRTVTRARAMLSARRCALGRVTRAHSPRVRKGRIIAQSRRHGARLPRGTRVNVAVSRGHRR